VFPERDLFFNNLASLLDKSKTPLDSDMKQFLEYIKKASKYEFLGWCSLRRNRPTAVSLMESHNTGMLMKVLKK